jgi:hypothetical protein
MSGQGLRQHNLRSGGHCRTGLASPPPSSRRERPGRWLAWAVEGPEFGEIGPFIRIVHLFEEAREEFVHSRDERRLE